MSCCDVANCNLLSHCITALSAANNSANPNDSSSPNDDNSVEVEFESASSEHLHLVVKYLNSWRARKCACVVRRSAHHSLVEVLFMLTTKSLVEELDKLRAIVHSLDDQPKVQNSSDSSAMSDGVLVAGTSAGGNIANTSVGESQLTNSAQIRPSSPLVSGELDELVSAVEVIFSSDFSLSNPSSSASPSGSAGGSGGGSGGHHHISSSHYFNKSHAILSRVLKNLVVKQHFMTSLAELFKSASPLLLPLSFVQPCVKLLSSVLRCVAQEFSKTSDELKLVSVVQRGQLRSSLVQYMQQLSEEELRVPKGRQSVEFCWEKIQEIAPDSIDTQTLDLALKYVKCSTLTMRLSGLAFITQQVSVCERSKASSTARNNSGGNISPSPSSTQSNSNPNNSKAVFKKWLKSQKMVSVLFGANTHVELVRQCHLIFQFMASGQLLTLNDIDVLWGAVNDKHKSREVISAIEGILHYLNESLLERFKKHLEELPLASHTDQTFSLSCQITKVCWRRQLMTLNIAHQFGSYLANEKRKRKHTGGSRRDSRNTNSQSGSSDLLTVKRTESNQGAISPSQTSDSLALNDESQYPPNATVGFMGESPVLTSSKQKSECDRVVLNPPAEWTTGNENNDTTGSSIDSSPSPTKSRKKRSPPKLKDVEISDEDNDNIYQNNVEETVKNEASKRQKLDRKSSKVSREINPPPPPPPPLRLSRHFIPAANDSSPDVNAPGPSRVLSYQRHPSESDKTIHGFDMRDLTEEQENEFQEMNKLFRGIQDMKTGINPQLDVDIGEQELRRSVDSNAGPGSESPLSPTGRRNSAADDLQDAEMVNSPMAQLGDAEDEDDDDDDVEDLEDLDEETSALYCCNQLLIRELLEQDGILKPVGVKSQQPLTVETSDAMLPLASEVSSNVALASSAGQVNDSEVSNVRETRSEDGEPSCDFEVISDQDESNSTDSTASSSSSDPSLVGSSFFVKAGSSLIWDLLTSNQLSDLAPEQQECVKQNLFDLVAVFLKYPEILKEMVRSLLNSVRNNCSTFMCVKMLQALFSNVVSLSNYAIQTHSMLDILVGTILSLIESETANLTADHNEMVESPEQTNTDNLPLTQSELGEFLHLFDAIFHKTSHSFCYTFSDGHIISLWTVLSTNPNYKDFFLNWLCGICQTDEIHIMTDQQWLMIYCKLVTTDSQWSKLQSDLASSPTDTAPINSELATRPMEIESYSSALQGTGPLLSDLAEVHLLAVLFCKAVKGVFFSDQQSSPGDESVTSSNGVAELPNVSGTSSSLNTADVSRTSVANGLSEIRAELISAGLQQFWAILLTSKDSEMQKMARDVLNGYYLHLPKLEKEAEFIASTFERISKFLQSDETFCLDRLKELQSIVCLLLHHIQQSYKKYSFHIRHSALKANTAPIHSHSKTWMPRKGSHQLKLYLANRVAGVNQPKLINMNSSDYLGELRADVTFHQNELLKSKPLDDSDDKNSSDTQEGSRLKYYRLLTNGLELKLEHDDRILSDLCIRDESQIAAVLTFLHCDDSSSEDAASKFQLGDVFLKFPGCLYIEPPLENYPQVILLQQAHFNRLFETLRRLSNLKSSASKAQIFNIDEIIRLVWDLIMLLPTYPAIQQQFEILSTDSSYQTNATEPSSSKDLPQMANSSSIDWSTILDVDNVFKLLYSLQMLEHLAINCHNKISQMTSDASLTPRGFGGHGANLLTPTLPNFDSNLTADFGGDSNSQNSGPSQSQNKNKVGSDWCQKFVEYGGLKFLVTVFESKVLLEELMSEKKDSPNVQLSEWKQECLASILRLFNIFALHPFTSGGLVMRSQNSFCSDSLSVGSQNEMYVPPQIVESSQNRPSFVSMLDKNRFLDSLFILMDSASKTQTDAVSRRTLSLKSNLVCQCFLILNLYACHDPSVCTSLMEHKLFFSLVYQLVVNFATKNISKTSTTGLTKLAHKSFAFCKKTIETLINFLAEVQSISEGCLEDHNNRDSRDSSVIADPSSGQEYFSLFENLMRIYLEKEEERASDADFVSYLVKSITTALDEFLQNAFWSEENGDCSSLRGLLTIMCSICRLKPPFVTSDQGLELIKSLMKCLFKIESETKTPKLVNPDSRKAAFDLIIQLASGCVKNYDFIYSSLMKQNSKEFHAPYPWSYWPLDERRSEAGFVGLINLGATCYMATALQHLFMIHEARSAILSANHNEASMNVANMEGDVPQNGNGATGMSNSNMERKHGKVLLELQKMFAYLQLSDRKAYNPRSFCRSYVMDNEPLNTCDQKDMTEFFNDLIAKLEDMSPQLRDLVHNLFRGEITNSVVSLDCMHVSKTVEQFFTVRCQVADLRDLYESLDEFCQIDMLEGDNMYTCSSCHTKVRAEKRASFKKLPRILVINTMRYKFNMESMAREKVNTHFLFPNHINMGKYTETYLVGDNSNSRSASGGATSSSSASAGLDSGQQEELNYELIGVTVHTGAAESGHYYCFVRDRSYPQSDVWFLFNDSEVKPFNPDNIPQECFGGQMVSKTFNQLTEKFVDYAFEKSHSAYMLFYERSVDLMRSEEKASLIPNLSPSETFCASINTDNLQLRHDRLLFDKNYFEFLYKFNDVVAKTLPTPGDPKSSNHFEFQRAKLSTTFVLETLVHSRESPSINFWLDFVTSLYSECVEVCKWLIKHLSQNDWWLNQVLIRCPNAHIRGLVQKLIFLAISNVCNKTSDDEWQVYCKSELRSFLKTLVNFTNSSLLRRRHLRHFFEYCSLLMDVARMGRRESLLLISVGTIGSMVKFFLDVKLHKGHQSSNSVSIGTTSSSNGGSGNNTTTTCVTLSDDEDESANSENDVIASTALEFDALNELLSFTADGKKKSAVFHNIVELIELLLDKSCALGATSGSGSNRDFQDLARCLAETDMGALTSNNYEFLKILIEEEINLDSVSSILQMLVRMDKNFENFIPVRFCELILSSGVLSPETVKPYLRVLAKVECQLSQGNSGVTVTQHMVKYMPRLLALCPRPTLTLIKECARSPHMVNWALNNLDLWVKQFLIAENNYRVRFEAAEVLMMLIPDSGHLYNYWKSCVDKFSLPDSNKNGTVQYEERVLTVVHKILRHLLGMLEDFPSLSMGTYRFQYFFTVLTALTLSPLEKKMFTPHFPHLWSVFYPHLIHSKVENCVNKQALLFYWHWVCVDCPQNVQITVSNKVVLKNIFFNYILVNHDERDLVAFNKQCLHSFFGLLRICCSASAHFAFVFMQHDNFLWALENVFPYYNLYTKASNELLKIVEILLDYAKEESAASPSGGSQLSAADIKEVKAFKKKLIFSFTKCLSKRGLFMTVPRIFPLLLQTEQDMRYLLEETNGLRVLSDALFSAFEASQHVSIFHSSGSSSIGGAQTAIGVRGDIVALLTRALRGCRSALEKERLHPGEGNGDGATTSGSSLSTGLGTSSGSNMISARSSSSKHLPQWKNISVTCEKLLSLLNASHSAEARLSSLLCLKEILLLYPSEASQVLVDLMFTAHSSCTRKKCTSLVPGPFYPRLSSASTSGSDHQSPPSTSTAVGVGSRPTQLASGSGIVGFNPVATTPTLANRRFELSMCVHREHFSRQIGEDKSYDCELRQFFSPYHVHLAQPLISTATQQNITSSKLTDLICLLSLDALHLKLDWFARTMLDLYHSNTQYLQSLSTSPHLALIFTRILADDHLRSVLNSPTVFSFCTSFLPKATALTLDDKLSHIVQLTSLMVDQSYHKRVSNVLIEGRSEQSVQMDGDGNEESRNKDPEEFILVIIQNLKALQLLFACTTCAKIPSQLSELKLSLESLREESEKLKSMFAKEQTRSSSLLSFMSSDTITELSTTSDATSSCNLPLKKLKLAVKNPEGTNETESSSKNSEQSLHQSKSEMLSSLVKNSEDLPENCSSKLVVLKQSVLNLVKNVNSTLNYLKQFEDRCGKD